MTALVGKVRGLYPIINTVAAVFLIAMGVLTLTNRLTVLNSFFSSFAPIEIGGQLRGPTTVGSPSVLLGKHPISHSHVT